MPVDLETELEQVFRLLPPPPEGLADAKRRGDRQRRRRRAAGAGFGVTVTIVVIIGLLAGLQAATDRKTKVVVGSSAATPPKSTGGEPPTFVALVNDGTLAVVDSHTGQVVRPLSPAGAGDFGTVSADGRTMYLSGGSPGFQPTCPAWPCAINLMTMESTVLPPFRWGGDPSLIEAAGVISPDGTHSVTDGSLSGESYVTVVIASSAGNPKKFRLPPGDTAGYPDSGWSPNDHYVYLANLPGDVTPAPGQTVLVVMNAKTGAIVFAPVTELGCAIAGVALSDTDLFAAEFCPSPVDNRIARYRLATGAPDGSVALPPGEIPQGPLAVDPSGQYLIASLHPAAVPCELNFGCLSQQPGTLWTEQHGVWTQLPGLMADNFAW